MSRSGPDSSNHDHRVNGHQGWAMQNALPEPWLVTLEDHPFGFPLKGQATLKTGTVFLQKNGSPMHPPWSARPPHSLRGPNGAFGIQVDHPNSVILRAKDLGSVVSVRFAPGTLCSGSRNLKYASDFRNGISRWRFGCVGIKGSTAPEGGSKGTTYHSTAVRGLPCGFLITKNT